MLTPGWAVRLEGESIDVLDLKYRLPAPFEPWIEDFASPEGIAHVLRSAAWSSVTEARGVYMDADRILERLHGEALLYDPDATRVKPGAVYNIRPDGRVDHTIVAMTAEVKFTFGRVRARGRPVLGCIDIQRIPKRDDV